MKVVRSEEEDSIPAENGRQKEDLASDRQRLVGNRQGKLLEAFYGRLAVVQHEMKHATGFLEKKTIKFLENGGNYEGSKLKYFGMGLLSKYIDSPSFPLYLLYPNSHFQIALLKVAYM